MRRFFPRGSERSRLVGEGLWVATGQVLTLVGRLVGIRLITGIVSPEVYGHVALLVGLGALAAGMLVTPVVQSAVRFYPDAARDGHPGALRSLTSRYLRWAGLLSSFVLLAVGLAWSSASGQGPTAWAYAFLALGFLADAARTYETGLLNAVRRQAAGSLWLAADSWLRTLCALAFLLIAGASAASVLAGYAVGAFVANVLFARRRVVPQGSAPEPSGPWAKHAAAACRAYAAPLIPLALLGWAFNLGDRYVLASVAGADATGLYSAAYGLGSMPFLALSGVLVTTFRPVLFEAASAGDRAKERRIVFLWIAVTAATGIAGVLLLVWLAPWVVRIALGSEFRVAAPLLPWIGAAYAVQNIQNVFETRIYARRRTGSFLVLSVASAAVAVSMYLVLIPRMGAMGAALGTLGGMIVSCAASILLSRLPEKPFGRAAALFVGVLTVAGLTGTAEAVPIAKGGTPLVPIVTPDEPTPAERTAAEMLALYLGSSVGSPFRVVTESDPDARSAAIHVGPTAVARAVGGDPAALGPEEWIVRTEGGNLVLAGGRPRGTLYAVSRFLEDVVGVRWWTPLEESVPGRPDLRTGPLDEREKPAFAYRDFFGLDGPPIFRMHLRLNGDASGLAPEWGGRTAFGMHGVHTFEILVPGDEEFERHPEFFSERAGFRTADRSQLCMSQEGLAPFVAARLLSTIREAREDARRAGLPPPELFDLSPNDWDGRCMCARCRDAASRDGSDAGPLLRLVDRVAEIVRSEEPEIRITTLAYTWYFAPPSGVRPGPGVVVRVSGYGVRDQIRSALDPGNGAYREALERWAAIAPGLWVWDYAVTYHDRFALPLPNLRTFGPDLRWYREIGVDGLFYQFDFPLGGDLHDLKVWVLAKLAEDPRRDSDALVREFTGGFYGPAGRHIRRYIRLMETAADASGARIGAGAEPSDFRWLDDETLGRAAAIFDKAERAARHDTVVLRRVREARAAVDWAVLRFASEGSFDRREVAARLRRSWIGEAESRLAPDARDRVVEWIDEVIPAARKKPGR